MAGQLRPMPGENAAAWTRAVFAAGDYAGAAMFGTSAVWQYHAARALVLGDPAAMDALTQFGHAEAKLYRGAAFWIHGATAAAIRELEGCPLPHAQRLCAIIKQPHIRVLAQLPWAANTCTDLLGGALHDPHFVVRNIGHRCDDVENQPYADVQRFVDSGFVPDFYISAMAEWHHLPPNLQALGCPIFGHIADHDLHIQTLTPWLSLFDEILVTDRTEWLDVQGLTRGPVSSFPKVFGLPQNLPEVSRGDRHLDFFVSGTMLDPYHPDKAKLLHELLSMPDIDLRVVRGFAGTMAFYSLLSASKASFTYVRRPGAMPTRGLESLALGCAVALQEESILNLFVGRNEGIANYGPSTGSLSDAVRTILGDWQHFEGAAQRGAEVVRAEFAMPRVASQYLRFLTFRAAAVRSNRQMVDSSTWCQKRVCVSRTWLPSSPVVRRRTMQANFRQLGKVAASNPSAAVVIDMARELLVEFAYYEGKNQVVDEDHMLWKDAVGLLEKACRLFPRHLVVRFNLVRALLHYGDARQRMQALQMAYDALEVDPGQWQIGPQDDVLPFDFHSEFFNYRDYLDLVARAEKGQPVSSVEYARIVLASLAGYVARKTGKPALHALCAQWDPAFARYRLDFARALRERGGEEGRRQARGLLLALAEGSAEFVAAGELLAQMDVDTATPGDLPWRQDLALRRIQEQTIDARIDARALFDEERRDAVAAREVGRDSTAASDAAYLSVLVPDVGSERELAALLTDLDAQSQRGLEVIVAIKPRQAESQAVLGVLHRFLGSRVTSLRSVEVQASASLYERLNACVAVAQAPLLTIALPGDRFRTDAFSLLCAQFDANHEVGVAFANEGWTATQIAHFDPSACVALSCRPPFGMQRMLATNAIGMHPVWRRVLHEAFGGFDAKHGCAAEHDFWLRVLGKWRVKQMATLLSASPLDAAWRALRDPVVDPAAAQRVCELHAGVRASSPLFVPQRTLPAGLFATGMSEEAVSHARLGILSESEWMEVRATENFYGTALLHGDHATARCLLRTVGSSMPSLLSAHLAEARFLDAQGLPGSEEILNGARGCEPYRAVVERLLGARRAPGISRVGSRSFPTKQSQTEKVPCPT